MIQRAMAKYAETNGMITGGQAGFRAKKSTHTQLEMLTMALEDAQLYKQDLYLLQMDFSEAFDTIDHDKLLMILDDLGYTADATKVIKDLYTDTKTTVSTPHGKHVTVTIDRGTIQGDSLSPFLFILYMEPLVRWLRVGLRGYNWGCLQETTQYVRNRCHCSDASYADDVNVLTGTKQNCIVQAQKVSDYADWAHLKVNQDETTVTGILHRTIPQDPMHNRMLQNQLQDQVTIQGKHIQYVSPKTPFKFLGVWL